MIDAWTQQKEVIIRLKITILKVKQIQLFNKFNMEEIKMILITKINKFKWVILIDKKIMLKTTRIQFKHITISQNLIQEIVAVILEEIILLKTI